MPPADFLGLEGCLAPLEESLLLTSWDGVMVVDSDTGGGARTFGMIVDAPVHLLSITSSFGGSSMGSDDIGNPGSTNSLSQRGVAY